jgi:hypothetical protein
MSKFMKKKSYQVLLLVAAALFVSLSATTYSGKSLADDIQFIPENMNYSFSHVDKCVPKKICAINNSNQDITDPRFSIAESKHFRIQEGFQGCPNPLPPGGTCVVYVNFCPELVREYQDVLKFSGSGSEIQIALEGIGTSNPP